MFITFHDYKLMMYLIVIDLFHHLVKNSIVPFRRITVIIKQKEKLLIQFFFDISVGGSVNKGRHKSNDSMTEKVLKLLYDIKVVCNYFNS